MVTAYGTTGTFEMPSWWFRQARLQNFCSHDTRCERCEPSGNCDSCDTIDGRFIGAVSDYASTCDGCGELTMHEALAMDPETQLGYCEKCVPGLRPEIRNRLEEK
jgi:hypothetical protein